MKPPQKPPKPGHAAKAEREAAEAAALRANLLRRKTQARAMASPKPEKDPPCR